MKTKILLIGGTGYLGQHLQKRLGSSFDIYITGTHHNPAENFFRLDFEDEKTFHNLNGFNFDILLCLASTITGIGEYNLNSRDLDVNVWGYKSFLQFVADKKLSPKVIYISSMTVYGIQNEAPVKETDLINPINIYGLSKSLAESITYFFSCNNQVKSVVIRIPGLFGGNRKSGYIYNIIQKCVKEEDVSITTQGLGYWECIEIDDFCSLLLEFLLLFKWDKHYDVFNFSYGEEIDFIDTAYYIKSYLKSNAQIIESGPKGYVKFFLCNEKLKGLTEIKVDFRTALEKYVNKLTKK